MLRLYQSNRLECLADLLVEAHRSVSASPLIPEILVVPHPGTARWLQQRLALERGVCANVRFPLPGTFLWEMFRVLLDDVPERNSYAPEVLLWRVFNCLESIGDESLWKQVRSYLASGEEIRRYQLAGRIAEVLDQYLVYRPDWIIQWESGSAAVQGDDWQAELWRRIRTGSSDDHWLHFHRRLRLLLEQGGARPGSLPRSVSVFGLSSLSPGFLDIINRLSEAIDLHLFLLNPCREYWTDIVASREKVRREMSTEAADLYLEVGNPLLASMGRQGRDFFAAVLDCDAVSVERFEDPGAESVLARVQSDILNLDESRLAARRDTDAGDQSMQFHSCHSALREIEILWDRLLDMFQRSPDLKPSDVLVMAPDIEDYAPFIETVFEPQQGRPVIPFRIIDRRARANSPVIETFLSLLDLPESRFDSNSILALLEAEGIQERFGIKEADLPSLRRWVGQSGIRWGQDAEFRAALGLPATKDNSWRGGLDRLLLGYALPDVDRQLFRGVLPCEAVEGSDALVLGALLEFIETLFEFRKKLAGRRSLASWVELLTDLIDRLFEPGEKAEADLQILRETLADNRRHAQSAGFEGCVGVNVVRMHLESQLAQRNESHGLMGQGVSFCSLAPMRSHPFEVICLLGMNDGRFPRECSSTSFDLVARHPRLGDRSRRAEDRYLFLETLISARRCFYVSFVGQDIRDASRLPPSVLVGELLDYLGHLPGMTNTGDSEARDMITVHPLQGFSSAYFSRGTGLFSYSREMFDTCRAMHGPKRRARSFIEHELVPPEPEWREVRIEQLTSFLANPARYFMQHRLGIRLESGEALLEAREPFTLESFDRFALTEELVQARLEAKDPQQVAAAIRATGGLPHGRIGEIHLRDLKTFAARFAGELQGFGREEILAPYEINIQLGPLLLTGWLTGLTASGFLGFSTHRLWDSSLLALWVRHLVLNASAPPKVERLTRWLDESGLLCLHPVENAENHLSALLGLYWQGLSRPLHFFPRSARAYMERVAKGADRESALKSARVVWLGDHPNGFPEWSNAYYRRAFPDAETLDGEFEQLSRSVYEPLFAYLESRDVST